MADKPFSNPSSLTEQLQNLCWRLATEMRSLYTAVGQRLDKTSADALYLGIKGKAASAGAADTATKATQDASGNVITATYATKAELAGDMTGATALAKGKSGLVPAPAAGKQTSFLRGDGTWVNVSSGIAPTGARGSLAGYETMSAGTTVSATSADAQTASSVTISDGSSGTSWTKIVGLSANATVTLGSSWHWVDGEAPELSAAGVLVCCWASTIGICSFASSGS